MAIHSSLPRKAAAESLAPPSPDAVLRTCGWLGPAEAGPSRVRNLSSSHSVHVATRSDGAEAIVKRPQPSARRGLAQELFVYRLSGWIPELAEVLPRALHIDESAQLLAIEALPQSRPGLNIRFDPAFHQRVGKTLARFHRATAGLALLPSPAAGILGVADHPDVTGEGRPEETRELMRRIAEDPLFADALRQALSDYRPSCLIHGDLRPEHWIELPGGELKLIDWEMGGGGDPALDLAAALAEPCLDRLRSGDFEAEWIDDAKPLIRAVIDGYSSHGMVDMTDEHSRSHLVRLAAARLLHVACEWADTGQLPAAVEAATSKARSLLQSPHRLADLIVP